MWFPNSAILERIFTKDNSKANSNQALKPWPPAGHLLLFQGGGFRGGGGRGRGRGRGGGGGDAPIEAYYSPDMLADPWKNLINKRQQRTTIEVEEEDITVQSLHL